MSVIIDTSVWSLALRRRTRADSSPAVARLQAQLQHPDNRQRFSELSITHSGFSIDDRKLNHTDR